MATKVPLSGGSFQDISGNVLANGTLVLSLSQDGQVNADAQLGAGADITIALGSDGNVSTSPAQYVWPNDVIVPANTFYNVSAYTASGQLVWGPNAQQIFSTPSPFDIGAWVPAEVNTGTIDSPFQSLTTIGYSGAATLESGVLNIPVYSGGSGLVTSVFGRTGTVVAASGDYSVGQVSGAAPLASPTFTGTVTAPTVNITSALSAVSIVAAVSGTNHNSPSGSFIGNYWNGTTSSTDTWSITNVMGPGTNPVSTLQFSHSGSSTSPTVNIPNLVSASINSNGMEISNAGTLVLTGGSSATSGSNVNSALIDFHGSYWTGTAASSDDWNVQNIMGTGTNPTSTLTFAHVGTSGVASVSFGVPVISVTASPGTNTTQLATTAFVQNAVSGSSVSSVFGRTGAVVSTSGDYSVSQVTGAAPIASPTFTGNVVIANSSSSAQTVLTAGCTAGSWGTLSVQSNGNNVVMYSQNQFAGPNAFLSSSGSSKGALVNQGAEIYVYSLGFSTAGGYPNSAVVGGYIQGGPSGTMTISNTRVGTDAVALKVIGTLNVSSTVTCSELQTTQTPTSSTTSLTHTVPIVLNGTTYHIMLSTSA